MKKTYVKLLLALSLLAQSGLAVADCTHILAGTYKMVANNFRFDLIINWAPGNAIAGWMHSTDDNRTDRIAGTCTGNSLKFRRTSSNLAVPQEYYAYFRPGANKLYLDGQFDHYYVSDREWVRFSWYANKN